MSSNWISNAFRYAALWMPALLLSALLANVAIATWVVAILREPTRFTQAPLLIQKLTRAAYWHTRKHWHTVSECVLFDTALLYRPRPGECVFENAEFQVLMHFDSLGARVTPAPIPAIRRGDSGQRVIIVGDSHAMGWGVEDNETFASLLASEHGFKTINLAVSSYGTVRELMRLASDIELRLGDIVVIQYADNDYAENRHFARHSQVGPFEEAELDALFAYQPTPVEPLPVAGLLLRLLIDDVREHLVGRGRDPRDDGISPTTAFLRVLNVYPALHGHHMLILAINGPGLKTHLSASQLHAVGLQLVEPALEKSDFLAIDDHMRPDGHRAVATALAAAINDSLSSE